ncbi:alpha/beta hydrolase [Ectobacillus sp. sgz5001026]|uniref:alpha/beta hydrolase n=1 Tax=Ectobacillus sp. sgz5001026 TaxID=3242473 RepID=UPI0036D2AAB0
MKVSQKTASLEDKEIQYTHIDNGGSVVCFMFSGSGYTYDKPLFYYSTMIMLQNQYDVVHIHYSYGQDLFELPLDDITQIIVNEVTLIINEVLNNHEYVKTVFLGKSLGTIPIINGFMKSNMYQNSKMILLTPLLKFDPIFNELMRSNHTSLIVIGEKDAHYILSKIDTIDKKTNMHIEKVPYANHSLDIEPFHTQMSIAALQKVMTRIEDFLKS